MVKTLFILAIKQALHCFITHSLIVFYILAIPVIVSANPTSIINGNNWLLNSQNPDGSWSLGESRYLDTYTALETLFHLNGNNTAISHGISWLTSQSADTIDDLSYKIILLSLARQDISSDLTLLLNSLNTDDGWGVDKDFDSDILDTTLALNVLNKINYADLDTIGFALSYLIDNQNIDGGFGFYSGDESNVFMTAVVLKVFSSYKNTFLLQPEIDDAAAYLLTKQNPDGGFGLSTDSTVFETALATVALIESGQGNALPLQDAFTYIQTNQQPNGSWDDDHYSTALALRALSMLVPNLSIASGNITLSPPAPQTGTTVSIVADVTNTGASPANNVTVRFSYQVQGGPASLIDEVQVPLINARETVQVQRVWNTFGIAGQAVIIIEVDPDDTIPEINNSDNLAEKAVYVGMAPNLTVYSEDSIITPEIPQPVQPFTVSFTVHNTGEVAAELVTVSLHREEPPDLSGGTGTPGASVLLGEKVIPMIGPGSSASVQWDISLVEGWHLLQLKTDPYNTILEFDENDNIGETVLSVLPAEIDLVIDTNLNILPVIQHELEPVTIMAQIHNYGGLGAENISVEIYDGIPGSGGILIDQQNIAVLGPMESTGVSTLTTFSLGEHSIYVVVDPLNDILEVDETNNHAVRTIQVAPAVDVDFVISDSDISVNPALVMPGDIIDISATVSNTGIQQASTKLNVYDGYPRIDGTLIISQDITISANSTAQIQFLWTVPNSHATLFFIVDEEDEVSEGDETNNSAHKRIIINQIDLAVSDNLIKTSEISYPAGEIFAVRGLVRNLGGVDAQDVLVQCYNGNPGSGGTLVHSETIPVLEAGTNKYVLCFLNAAAGRNEIFYVIDPDSTIQEMLEINNVAKKIIYGIDPNAPDISVTMFDTDSLVTDNNDLTISGIAQVTLENPTANDIISNFDLTIFEDTNRNERYDDAEDNILGTHTVSSGLLSGAVSNLSVPVSGTVQFAGNRLFIMADSQNQVTESNEENNLSHDKTGCILQPEIAATFDITEEWVWTGGSLTPGSNQSSTYGVAPIVANLTDDNFDGLVDENDVPDIVFITSYWYGHSTQMLRAVSGDTGKDIFAVAGNSISGGVQQTPAVADIDLDGLPEILVANTFGQVSCYENDGTFKWISDNYIGGDNTFNASTIIVGDVEGDGVPEILYRGFVFNNDGTTKLNVSYGSVRGNTVVPVLADIDLSGDKEIIMGNSVYQSDGSLLWHARTDMGGFCAVGNFDADSYPEVTCASGCMLSLFEHDGLRLWETYIPDDNCDANYSAGRPVIADFDGDGEAEIAVIGSGPGRKRSVTVFDKNGTANWTFSNIARTFTWGGLSPIAFDLNSDGKYELIFREMYWLHVLDGETGAVLYQTETNLGGTSVADVDNDGQVEIVMTGRKYYNGDPYYGGLRILGSTLNNWPGSRRIWNQDGYHISNINEDSSVPPIEKSSWLDHNTFRTNISVHSTFTASDLTVSKVSIYDTGFPQSIILSGRIGNGGNVITPSAVIVSFYDGDPANGGTLIGTTTTSHSLAPGEFENLSFTWMAPHTAPWDIYIVADDIGTGLGVVEECNDLNNTASSATVVPQELSDLRIYQSDITISPAQVYEGDLVTISADTHNIGSADANNIIVRFFDGNPVTGGGQIGQDINIAALLTGETKTVQSLWSATGWAGDHFLYITIDPDNNIPESREENNSAFIIVEVLTAVQPDLVAGYGDFSLEKSVVNSGELVTLSLNVHNFGTSVANVEVGFYIGDPLNGGIPLGEFIDIPQYLYQDDIVQVLFILDTAGLIGLLDLYAYVDPQNIVDERHEDNNIAIQQLQVNPSVLEHQVDLDKTDYNASEDLTATLTLINSTANTQDIAIDIEVLDQNDNLLAALANQEPVSVPPSVSGNTSIIYNWNTGTTIAGTYHVHAKYYKAGNYIGSDRADFTIIPQIGLKSSIVTDKTGYTINETLNIMAAVQSLSTNYILENLSAEIMVTDASGAVLFSESQAIITLIMGQRIDLQFYWNTSVNPPGNYNVTIEVKDINGAVIATSTNVLTISSEIRPSKLLSGNITVDNQSLLQGELVNINYDVSNIGNIDLSLIDLSISTVHVVELTAYDTLTDQTSLLMGETFTNTQQLDTPSYTAKDYLVILSATISGVEETLASTYFRVEGAPSAPSLNWPIHGEDVETLIPMLIINNASDPNNDKLTYEFELYSDSSLTTLLASASSISEGTNTTSWIVPFALTENSMYVWRVRVYDGLLYGDWMPSAAFRVNLTNEAPTAPMLSSPVDGSVVDIFNPILTINNSTDPDSTGLIYNFDVALDAGFINIVASEIGLIAGNGTTSMQVPVALSENTTYYWRAQADDWLIEGPWMATASFFVNTSNDSPTAPTITAPIEGEEIPALNANVIATGATDPEFSSLTYLFEADTAITFDSQGLMSSGNIPEGAIETIWSVTGLTDNTTYYVRANANDSFIDSPWAQVVSFFVNTVNDAPSTPVLANPSDRGAVNVLNPSLSVHNSIDFDGDILTYEFEVYDSADMTNLLESVTGIFETPQTTSLSVISTLVENAIYFWRARSFDGALYSNWIPLASFMVNTANDAPGAPLLSSPAAGSSVETLTPSLAVINAIDPDSDILTYEFEIYENNILVQTITGVPEDITGITALTLSAVLTDNTTYQWRATAFDGDRYGAWMDMATFSIHLPVSSITATIDFRPRTLNKESEGRWLVVYIELPQGYDINNIDRSSILLEGTIPARHRPYRIGDHDWDGIPDLKVKFKRSDVINVLPEGEEVPVTVTGLVGTTTFEGVDIIRVIPEHRERKHHPKKRCKSNHYWKRHDDDDDE